MKKLLSIMIALALVMSVGSINAFAQEVQERYYDENGNLQTVTINTEMNARIELEKSSYSQDDFPEGGVVLEFAEPCTIYAWFSCPNKDQAPGPVYPVDMALNYEMRLGAQDAEFVSWFRVQYGPQYGDYEYLRYVVTEEDLAAAGGLVSVYWNVRSEKFPNYPLRDLFQKMTMGIAAYTTPPTTANTNPQAQVKGTYQASGEQPATVYSVDVSWGSLEYVYDVNNAAGTWNPETHMYEGATMKWTCNWGADQITVTNHSNAAVKAGFMFTADPKYAAITGSFSNLKNNVATLPTAVGTPKDEAPAVTTSLVLDGALDASTADSTPIGTVTVTIISAA